MKFCTLVLCKFVLPQINCQIKNLFHLLLLLNKYLFSKFSPVFPVRV